MNRQVILKQVFSSKMLPSRAEELSDAAAGCTPAATSLFTSLWNSRRKTLKPLAQKLCNVKLNWALTPLT